MKTRSKSEIEFIPVIPVDDGTRAMLAYAESPAGRARIEKARQELRDGKGIAITPQHFSDLNRRISQRVNKGSSIDA
jgi:hypothetical protein